MADRIHSLHVLERVRRSEIEQEIRELADLRAERDSLDRAIKTLTEDMQAARSTTRPEGMFHLASYIAAAGRDIELKNVRIKTIAPRIETLEDKVLGIFAEMKTYEIMATREKLSRKNEKNKLLDADLQERHMLMEARLRLSRAK